MNRKRINKHYIVKCEIGFGADDLLDCEYSGKEHCNKQNAQLELRRANNDPKVYCAWIEEIEV